MVHPTPNGLVGHRHSALRQQILDVTQAEGEPEVEPYCLVNDLGRETIPGVVDLVHPRWATRPPRTPQAQSAVTMPGVGVRTQRDVVAICPGAGKIAIRCHKDRRTDTRSRDISVGTLDVGLRGERSSQVISRS